MPTAKQKKLRAERVTAKRRRLHGRKAKTVTFRVYESATNPPSMQDLDDDVAPARAKCPVCHFSQKVRKDGTMSRHDVYHGSESTQCEGTGQPWTAASPA